MDWKYVEQQIEYEMGDCFPNGAGRIGAARAKHALEKIAREAWNASRTYHLSGLLDITEAHEAVNAKLQGLGRRPISSRRMRALAADRHARFGVGRQIARGVWLFAPDEIDNLIPHLDGERFE